jgi:hypothetical protein
MYGEQSIEILVANFAAQLKNTSVALMAISAACRLDIERTMCLSLSITRSVIGTNIGNRFGPIRQILTVDRDEAKTRHWKRLYLYHQ